MSTAWRPTSALTGNRCMVRVRCAWPLFVVDEAAVRTTMFARTPLTPHRLDETVVRVGLRRADRTTTDA